MTDKLVYIHRHRAKVREISKRKDDWEFDIPQVRVQEVETGKTFYIVARHKSGYLKLERFYWSNGREYHKKMLISSSVFAKNFIEVR